MNFKNSNRLKMAAFLLAYSVSAVAIAQTASDTVGVVRITDGRGGANARASGNVQQVAANQNGTVVTDGAVSGNCPPGAGMNGACPPGNNCQYGRCRRCPHCLLGNCQEHYCCHSPDYGYSPPAKYPLQRRGVEYTTYFPNQWYGAGADYSQVHYPMVYQPTDTTQLGFYYQHVPFWQPQPNMLPDRPIPAQWNIVAPPVAAANFCGPCNFGSPYYHGNRCRYRAYHQMGIWHRPYGMAEYCPADYSQPSGPVTPLTTPTVQPPAGGPSTAPVPVETGAPSPIPQAEAGLDMNSIPSPSDSSPNVGVPLQRVPARQDSASSGHIRRLGYLD